MKINLDELKTILGVDELKFFKSTTSKRLVSYGPKKSFMLMTNDGKFDEKEPIYVTILEPSPEYEWISEYDVVAQLSNKPGAEAVMTL